MQSNIHKPRSFSRIQLKYKKRNRDIFIVELKLVLIYFLTLPKTFMIPAKLPIKKIDELHLL